MEQALLLSLDGMTVPCKLTEPDFGGIRRVVLGVHGFGGSMNDPIQVSLAEEMGLFSAATLRFDFPTINGALTLQGCVDALLAAAKEAKQRYPQVEDLCVFATGFGAYVTLTALEDLLTLPGNVRLVVQTPSVRMDETLLSMLNMSRETLWAMDRLRVPLAQPFDVTYRFYEELRDHPALIPQPIPMLILHGEADNFIDMADIQLFRQLNDQAKLVIIPGASHRFLEDGAWDMVLDLTRDWFAYEQVLLTDWE